MYSTNQETGTCMPLLMGYTQPEKIREVENEEPVVYDHRLQIVVIKPFVMRLVATRCKKSSQTGSKNNQRTDVKNEIDDQKNV